MDKFKNFEKELKLKGFSINTIKLYLYYNKKFLDFIGKDSRSVSKNDIKRYLSYLISKKKEPRTVNTAHNALKSYYHDYMNRRVMMNIKRSKIPKNLPYILTKNEIENMIDTTNNLKHKLLIELLYSSGLRISECIKLKVKNIDLENKIVFIKQGKGKKDRFVITSDRFIEDLKYYLEKRKINSEYLFETKTSHITVRTAQQILKQSAHRAGIGKNVYPHLFRASFATHLLENGTSLEKVQKVLGHSRIDTTMGYIKTKTDDLKNIKNPLD